MEVILELNVLDMGQKYLFSSINGDWTSAVPTLESGQKLCLPGILGNALFLPYKHFQRQEF